MQVAAFVLRTHPHSYIESANVFGAGCEATIKYQISGVPWLNLVSWKTTLSWPNIWNLQPGRHM